MNKVTRQLAEQAEFVFWDEDESHAPLEGGIDWSSDYTEEFEKYSELIVRKCADVASNLSYTAEGPSNEALYQRNLCARAILEYFGYESKSPISNRNVP
jgi:hypothetical protein